MQPTYASIIDYLKTNKQRKTKPPAHAAIDISVYPHISELENPTRM